ncbi:MAG: organomercurial lyase, partial [Candidatus Limnocylindria bacterium]
LLAEGRPVSSAEIAEASGLSLERVETALRGIGDTERMADGRVEGFGLTPHETPHRIRIGDVDRYAWCAMDTLFFAAILDRRVEVESPDGTTGELLRFEADGRRILAADPPSIVVSWFVNPAAEGVRAAVCQFGHFYASAERAAAWLARYPKGGIMSLAEALEAARRSAIDDFGATS